MTMKQDVLKTLRTKVNKRKAKNFTGADIDPHTWDLRNSSRMRTLRQLKEEGTIDYRCISQYNGTYTLLSI